jgi:hypothetical protein
MRLIRRDTPVATWFENMNTPEEWDGHLKTHG